MCIRDRSCRVKSTLTTTHLVNTFIEMCIRDSSKRVSIEQSSYFNLFKSSWIKLWSESKVLPVWLYHTYASETRTLRKTEKEIKGSRPLRCLEGLLKIPWTGGISNEKILSRMIERSTLMKTIFEKKSNMGGRSKYHGNLRHSCQFTTSLEGMMEGFRIRRRARQEYMDEIEEGM